jgi:protein-arginine kinase activator protein McsA
MRKCIRCGDWKDESEFNIRNKARGYLQSVCRNCHQQDSRNRYANDPERVKEINRNARMNTRSEAERFVYEYLSNHVCADCGEYDFSVLTFDHVRGQKKYNVADMIQQGLPVSTIMTEIEKTDVVCFNCHMRREQKRRGGGRFRKFWPK